ncbi:MAG: response regulator transcription factor [Epsilonproteobacteria bacterium]|nr:response regulator transcription factor [Campylobacterota bacterium]OIO17979.1 MAG: DNA-binding response regulator [Helicobacteraceae bacterium CG1_02_36_14]PIP09988.1 MAG: DNA-binding response regulator [Sulfurimonas sp. CG23_combo_of_CG06-09_8_20_14_all_36_33]PIS25227.1 MAG: DNA-binding response regulator [Sulfurimonas sp. CG08_land_8_20_14_0_20_36_33]PIU35361.1 MAG: DNA-binding response regulator [Sulfurimonas sp. CG07_land_8_20_14_0_80_36_56]PIV05178.1 MAG: DNA-binding response regulato
MDILIVEDNELTAKQLFMMLKSEKYDCDVASGYREAQDYIDKNNYSLILLDWNLGDGDGLVLLKEIREMEIKTPVLMLSANSEIDSRVAVLDSGADDYLCKPYSNVELLARMRALLRRESKEKSAVISFNGVTLNITTHEVFVDDKLVELTGSEYDLLELFMQNPNVVLTRYQLSEHINKDNYSIKHSNIVDVHIKNLRKKLDRKDFIVNIRGVGYRVSKSS